MVATLLHCLPEGSSEFGWHSISLALAAILGVVGLIYALHLYARRLAEDKVLRDNGVPKPIQPPVPQSDLDWYKHSLPADIYRGTIASEDGSYSIEYLLFLNPDNPNNKSLLVFCQGRMTVMQEGFRFLPFLINAGHHVLLFNYRGVGTPGHATFMSVCQDAALAHRFGMKVVSHLLAGGWGPPPIEQEIALGAPRRTGLLGYSLGGFTAAHAAGEHYGTTKMYSRARGSRYVLVSGGVLALMDTGTDMYDSLIARAPYVRFLFPSWLLKPHLNNLAIVRRPYPAIKLIAHGECDDTSYPDKDERGGNPKMSFGFPFKHGKRLFAEAAGINNRFFQFRRSSHKDMDQKDPDDLRNFFRAIYDALNAQPQIDRGRNGCASRLL